MKFSPNCLSQDVLANFDTDLQVFYHDIVAEELNLCRTNTVVGIRQALKDVVHAYKKPTVESHASQILFDSQAKRSAYVLKHCPCFSSAVGKHFFQLLSRNQDIQLKIVHRQVVNLCCLGGGPGTEAVAIVKVIDSVSKLAVHGKKIHLRVWVVDLSKDWEATTRLILNNVQQFPELCDSAKLTISFEMVEADLTKPLEEKVKNVLRDADIITMVYFVSAVNGSKSQNKCAEMLQNIMDFAKAGALVFFLDSAKELHYNAVMSAANKFHNMKQIYGPFVQEFHTLSLRSVRKFIELYFTQFNAILCLTNCFVTTAGWTKVNIPGTQKSRTESRQLSDDLDLRVSTKSRHWNKMVKHNTMRQERFRQRVEKLLLSELKMDFITDDLEDEDCCLEADCLDFDRKMFYAAKEKRKRIIINID